MHEVMHQCFQDMWSTEVLGIPIYGQRMVLFFGQVRKCTKNSTAECGEKYLSKQIW